MNLHFLVKKIIDILKADATVSSYVPGDWHYGERVRSDAIRPYGLISIKELGREYLSSYSYLIDYELSLKVYVGQKVKTTGDTSVAIASCLNLMDRDDLSTGMNGDLIIFMPTSSSLSEDENTVQGSDILASMNIYTIKFNENEI